MVIAGEENIKLKLRGREPQPILERDHRSSGEHLTNSTKKFHTIQPLSLHQGLNLKESVVTHIAWRMNRRT